MTHSKESRHRRPASGANTPVAEASASARGLRGVKEQVEFFAAFVRRPARTGSVAPSSNALARAMLEGCDVEQAGVVVEIGPGTGAFSRQILRRIGEQTRFIALELDGLQVARLRERYPRMEVHEDSAERIARYLPVPDAKADIIISGLPWANFDNAFQERILGALIDSLSASGTFATFAYLHARWFPRARQFRTRLEHYFREVGVSRVVWRNIPPAFVYRCRQPRR